MNEPPKTFTLCPECKKYLSPYGKYKFCMYCGTNLQGKELLKEEYDPKDENEKDCSVQQV